MIEDGLGGLGCLDWQMNFVIGEQYMFPERLFDRNRKEKSNHFCLYMMLKRSSYHSNAWLDSHKIAAVLWDSPVKR